MNDPRTIICGMLAGVGVIASTVLYALGEGAGAGAVGAFAGTALGYVVGLHSEPQSGGEDS